MTDYLNSFRPICRTATGRRHLIENPKLPAYADASCRREPDLEHVAPAITCICRGKMFTPRLKKGDRVIYITVKQRYPGALKGCWGIVAALKVVDLFDSHSEGARWYEERELPLPSNCFVEGRDPLPVELTEGFPRGFRSIDAWDRYYKSKVGRWPRFVVTEAALVDLQAPAIAYPDDLNKIFGRVPGTRNPPAIATSEYDALLAFARSAPNGRLTRPVVKVP